MDRTSLANQLDDAIEMMIAEPDSAPPKIDLNIGELLGIAAELRLLPDPAFRATLKAQLLGPSYATPIDIRRRSIAEERARQVPMVDPILPSLLGAGDGTYPVHRGNFAISAAIHAALLFAVATAGLWMADHPRLRSHTTAVMLTDISPYALPISVDKSRGGGGGGDRDKLAESKGNLPRFAREQITPPTIVVRNEQPKLPAEPTLVGAPALTTPQTSPIGNPLSAILQPSNGIETGGGFGTGSGGGAGPGEGPGFGPGHGGGIGGGVYRVRGGVSAPRPIYDPDPEYSEEARHAKYQGTVLLWVIVGQDGLPRDIRVQRSLGMGLDEKAIAAVQNWRFEPSMKDGRPVAVQVNIEVTFRLY
jgi:periplasmic protein TonB